MSVTRIGHRYIDVKTGVTLDIWFPKSNKQHARDCLAQKHGIIRSDFIEVTISDFATPPASIEEVYLRLHLLSECKMAPNSMNLDGIFALLTNVAWTSAGTIRKVWDII